MNERTMENQWTITYHQDGLLDMFIGITLLGFGIGILTRNTWLSSILPAALVPVWISARSSLLRSRVQIDEVRSSAGSLRLVALAGLFTLTFIAGVGAMTAVLLIPEWMHAWTKDLLLGLGGALLLDLVGLILSARRLYVYALLSVVIFAISYIFNGPLWLSMVVLSGIIILIGMMVLLRFLSEHPGLA
jgi:hypothetical protein